MDASRFDLTFDYRCPFARNVHEYVVRGLEAGARWEVGFRPFSLSQAKVEAGEPLRWDDPAFDTGLLALQVGVAVRDGQPEHFPTVHRELFALRHDHGGNLRDETALRAAIKTSGVDVDGVFDEVASGRPLATVQREHERGVADSNVWGVPTFVIGEHAAFVRLMDRPGQQGDDEVIATVERIVDAVAGWPQLNELKHTTIPR